MEQPAAPLSPMECPELTRIRALLSGERAERSFSQPFYLDADVFRAERLLLQDQWMFAAHLSEVPVQGYLEVEIFGESIILSRQDGALHALFNVCIHRGSQIVKPEECSSTQGLVCPYHGWRYALDGRLEQAPVSRQQAGASEARLRSAAVAVVEGLVFVALNLATPIPLAAVTEKLTDLLSYHDLQGCVVAARQSYSVEANWKLVVENFLECYHCLPNHPELCSTYSHIQITATDEPAGVRAFISFSNEWMARARAMGTPVRAPQRLDPRQDQFAVAFRLGIKAGFETLSEGGAPIAPLLGQFENYDGGETFGFVGPFLHFSIANDHAVVIRIIAEEAQQTRIEVSWLVRGDAREGDDYDREKLVWLWGNTVAQDCEMVARAQRGIRSMAYRPGPYMTLETDTKNFKAWYLRYVTRALGEIA